jgi:ABC-type dipeptide/oligopeptide/nickel transport system permease component
VSINLIADGFVNLLDPRIRQRAGRAH